MANHSTATNLVSLVNERFLSLHPYFTAKHSLNNCNKHPFLHIRNTPPNIAYLVAVYLGVEESVYIAADAKISNPARLVNGTMYNPTYLNFVECPSSFNAHILCKPFSVCKNRPEIWSWPLGFPVHEIGASHCASWAAISTVLPENFSGIFTLVSAYADVGSFHATTRRVQLVLCNQKANIAILLNRFPTQSSYACSTIFQKTFFFYIFGTFLHSGSYVENNALRNSTFSFTLPLPHIFSFKFGAPIN